MSKRTTFITAFLVGIVGNLILFRSVLDFSSGQGLWGGNYDPRLLTWIAEWGYHVLFETQSPLEFWNANSFYPHTNSLAFSDSLLSLQIFYSPLRMFGVSKLTALYISLALFSTFACVLSNFALARIGKLEPAERILILIAAHFSLSMTNFLGHYQLFAVQLAIPFFLYLYIFLQTFELRYLTFLCLIFSLAVCFAGYLAPMLCSLTIFVALPQLYLNFRHHGLEEIFKKIGTKGLALIGCTILVLYFTTFNPYLKLSKTLPPQDYNESALYAARPTSIFHHLSTTSKWYAPDAHYASIDTERAFAPGYILLHLPICILLLTLFAKISGKPVMHSNGLVLPFDRDFLIFAGILLFACLVLALGPYPIGRPSIKLPFYWLAYLVPGLDHARTPGRFGMILGLPLSIFVIWFIRCFDFQAQLRRNLTYCLAALIALESIPSFKTFPFAVFKDDQLVYSKVAAELKPGTPLLELPLASSNALRSIIRVTQQLNGSTIHWARLFVGYGAGSTPELRKIQSLDLGLHRNKKQINELIQFARAYSVQYVLVRIDRYYPKIQKKWQRFIQTNTQIDVIFREGNSVLIKLKVN